MKTPPSFLGAISGSASLSRTKTKKDDPQPDGGHFKPATEKLTIVSLDDDKLQVAAQFNPKELGISKTVQWQQHNELDNRPAQQQNPKQGHSNEYTGGGQRSMSIELFFDRFEPGPKGEKSIEELMEDLNTLASITDPDAKKEEDRRPHYCVVVWGIGGMRPFRCVIESLEIKYTMFNTMGVPLRAVATVKVKETSIKKDGKEVARIGKELNSLAGRT